VTLHYNRYAELAKRRQLRTAATPAEQRLWQHLRGNQTGTKFRRQYSIDCFVLDFYSPECKLAVEVDGDSHFQPEAVEYDKGRTEHVAGFGIEVVRVTNGDVMEKS